MRSLAMQSPSPSHFMWRKYLAGKWYRRRLYWLDVWGSFYWRDQISEKKKSKEGGSWVDGIKSFPWKENSRCKFPEARGAWFIQGTEWQPAWSKVSLRACVNRDAVTEAGRPRSCRTLLLTRGGDFMWFYIQPKPSQAAEQGSYVTLFIL